MLIHWKEHVVRYHYAKNQKIWMGFHMWKECSVFLLNVKIYNGGLQNFIISCKVFACKISKMFGKVS